MFQSSLKDLQLEVGRKRVIISTECWESMEIVNVIKAWAPDFRGENAKCLLDGKCKTKTILHEGFLFPWLQTPRG